MYLALARALTWIAIGILMVPWVACHCACDDVVEYELRIPGPRRAAPVDRGERPCTREHHAPAPDDCTCEEHSSYRAPWLAAGDDDTNDRTGADAAPAAVSPARRDHDARGVAARSRASPTHLAWTREQMRCVVLLL